MLIATKGHNLVVSHSKKPGYNATRAYDMLNDFCEVGKIVKKAAVCHKVFKSENMQLRLNTKMAGADSYSRTMVLQTCLNDMYSIQAAMKKAHWPRENVSKEFCLL